MNLVPQSLCPYCGYHPDAATSASGFHVPEVGDITICFNCGEVGRFDETMKLAKVTAQELVENLDVRHLVILERMQVFLKERGPILKERKN
jgi:hypothetical protein